MMLETLWIGERLPESTLGSSAIAFCDCQWDAIHFIICACVTSLRKLPVWRTDIRRRLEYHALFENSKSSSVLTAPASG